MFSNKTQDVLFLNKAMVGQRIWGRVIGREWGYPGALGMCDEAVGGLISSLASLLHSFPVPKA
jgi:hypothetical protein